MSAKDHKVLFLTFWYPSVKHPGFGVFVKEHAKAIKSAGIEVQLCAYQFKHSWHPFRRREQRFVDENGVVTHLLVIESLFYRFIQINPWHNFLLLKGLLRNIQKEFNFNIIHANVVSPCGVVAMLLAKHFKVPYIITEHWTRLKQYLKNNKLSFMGKRAYANAGKVTAVSVDLKNTIVQAFGVKPQHVQVVPNVVDTAVFYNKDSYQETPGVLRFVFVGNLRPPKRPDLIINALHRLQKDTGKSITLHVFGSGKMQQELEAQKEQLKIIWHGVQPKPAIAKLHNEVEMLLHASENETFCLAVAEAICCGTPVVVSELPVLGELVEAGSSGLLAPNTVEGFYTSIVEALKVKWNRKQIAAHNAGRFTPEIVGQQFCDIYDQVQKSTGNEEE